MYGIICRDALGTTGYLPHFILVSVRAVWEELGSLVRVLLEARSANQCERMGVVRTVRGGGDVFSPLLSAFGGLVRCWTRHAACEGRGVAGLGADGV